MNGTKIYQLQDLIEKIDRVDKMIKLHSDNPSKFMLVQYETKKQKLLSYLIDELVDAKYRSLYSFRIILLALKKFYPEIVNDEMNILSEDKHYRELENLESVLT